MTALAVIAAVLWTARLVMFVALHLVPSPYTVRANAVSDYAVGPTRALSSAMTWTTAAAWAALWAAVFVGLPEWSDRTEMLVCLGILTVVFVALPFVPTVLEGERITTIGWLHYILAIAWFALAYNCTGNFTRLIAGEQAALGAVLDVLHWIALVSLIALIVALVLPKLRRRVFGLVERVFILAITLFYLLASIGLAIL